MELAQKRLIPNWVLKAAFLFWGTSGIVEPMSEQALIESIYIELNMLAANNTEKTLLITPGNYGEHFVRENTNLNLSRSIKCSNYIGQTLDKAVELGFERILCIGHIGKFIKLAGGIMNTHSNMADCRMELFAAHTAMYCADCRLIHNIMACITTDQVLDLLEERNLTKQVMTSILEKIDMHLTHRVGGQVKIGAILFPISMVIWEKHRKFKKYVPMIYKQRSKTNERNFIRRRHWPGRPGIDYTESSQNHRAKSCDCSTKNRRIPPRGSEHCGTNHTAYPHEKRCCPYTFP